MWAAEDGASEGEGMAPLRGDSRDGASRGHGFVAPQGLRHGMGSLPVMGLIEGTRVRCDSRGTNGEPIAKKEGALC